MKNPQYQIFCRACRVVVEEGEYLTKPARDEMERIKAGHEVYCATCGRVAEEIMPLV